MLASISARGEIPTKFIYLDGGAERWDRVYKERGHGNGMSSEEMSLLLSHINGFLGVFSKSPGVNLIDLGCGNGLPAIQILKQFSSRDFKLTYTAVDLSEEMIELALKNLASEFKGLEVNKFRVDFEKESLTDELINIKQQNNYPSLMINLGNTLGNYVNASAVLTNFLESMTLDDYLLIGNGLVHEHNPQRILAAYNTDALIEIATAPPRLLGIYDSKDDFEYFWNVNRSQVEGRIKLGNNKKVKLAGQDIYLEKGEEILVLKSQKYSEPSLTKLLSDASFRTELLTTTKDREYILTLVQPTRYSI